MDERGDDRRGRRARDAVRAALLERYGAPLRVTEVAEPRPAEGEALVRVRAAGICATDLKIVSGAFEHLRLPLVPGHEVAGDLVEAAGGLDAGRRVAVALYDSCDRCAACRSGHPTLCREVRRIGMERDGGMAEYVAVPVRSLLPFGDAIDHAAAAVTMDAVTTPWRALRGAGRLQAGERVAIVGAGGLGLNGVQVAVDAGAHVAVVEPDAERRGLASELGAELAVAPGDVARVREWAQGGADLALEVSGVRGGFDTALDALRPGGRLVCCGYRPGLEFGLDSARLVLDEIEVVGSRAGGREDARAALAAVEEGRIRPRIMDRLDLEGVNDALGRLAAGAVSGRVVIELSPSARP
jgi:2-desacetyl-2-hydroxyethyl bacteriochlorophyllide A dehydrogenase